MLRIGIDARPLTSESAGLRTYAINTVRALLKHSEIGLYLYTNDEATLLTLITPTTNCKIQEIPNWKGGSRHIVLPYYAIRHKLNFMLFLCNSSWWVFGWWLSGCKTAIVVHDLIPDLFPEIFFNSALSKAVRYIQKTAYKRADILITGSKNAQEQIARALEIKKTNIHVIYHGLDISLSSYPKSDDMAILKRYSLSQQKYLLYVGSLDIRKNIPSLITAFADLVSTQHISHKLALTGTPSQIESKRYPDILTQVNKLHIEDKIVFLGIVDDDELPALFRHASVFVFPSLHEGFGLPPLEAMACGTPVVCSNIPPMTEILGDGVNYVDSTRPNALAQSILSILEDKSLRDKLVANGLKHSRQFTWDAAAEQLINIFKSP